MNYNEDDYFNYLKYMEKNMININYKKCYDISIDKLDKLDKYDCISGLNSNSLSASDNYILSKKSNKSKKSYPKLFLKLFICRDTDFLKKYIDLKNGNIVYENYIYAILQKQSCPFILKYIGYNTNISYNDILNFISNMCENKSRINDQFDINTTILLLKLRNFGTEIADGFVLKKNGEKDNNLFDFYQGIKKDEDDKDYLDNTRLSITNSSPTFIQIYPEDFLKHYSKNELENEFNELYNHKIKNVKFGYIITQYKDNTISLHDFLNEFIKSYEDKSECKLDLLKNIIIQFLVAIHTLIKLGINHNDLHFGNILVEKLTKNKIISFENNTDFAENLFYLQNKTNFLKYNKNKNLFYIKTKYVVKLFDFDYANQPEVFPNPFSVPLPTGTEKYFYPNKDIICFFVTFFRYFYEVKPDNISNINKIKQISENVYDWIRDNSLLSIIIGSDIMQNSFSFSYYFPFCCFKKIKCDIDSNIILSMNHDFFISNLSNPLYENLEKITKYKDCDKYDKYESDFKFKNAKKYINEIIYNLLKNKMHFY